MPEAKGRMVWPLSLRLLPNLCLTAANVVLAAQDMSFYWSPNHFSSHYLHLPSDTGYCVTQRSGLSRQDGQKLDVQSSTFLLAGNVNAADSGQEAQETLFPEGQLMKTSHRMRDFLLTDTFVSPFVMQLHLFFLSLSNLAFSI